MEQILDWEVILDLALKQVSLEEEGSVGGSKFRAYVAKVAEQNGVVFPPEGMLSFSKFLESFPHKLIVQRTPGRDIQIAPINHPELLVSASSPNNAGARIREDFFLAMTAIPSSSAPSVYYYLPELDRVERFENGVVTPPSAISVTPTSYENEILIRREFVSRSDLSALETSALNESLDGKKALSSFTNAIRSHGLSQKWHQFRLQQLAESLKAWSDQKAVAWQPTWISGTHERYNTVPLPDEGVPIAVTPDRFSSIFWDRLSAEDMSRISVPLDIVLKLLNGK